MRIIQVEIPTEHYRRLSGHLLRPRSDLEQAAFLFVRAAVTGHSCTFSYIDSLLVSPRGFSIHSEFHLELDDQTRARVIKTAHDLQCSILEIHSHPGTDIAMFSASDFMGLEDFVPHVWWRLKKRPYAALVMARRSFDGLAWFNGPNEPEPVESLVVDGQRYLSTGLSFKSLTRMHHESL